jgi:Plasmid pRiA4b ORF-3-like protein
LSSVNPSLISRDREELVVTFNFHRLDKLSYDDAEPLLEEYFEDLITQFLNSAVGQAYFQAYPDDPSVGNWTYHFLEMGYLYGETPPPKITRSVAQSIMEYTLPRKLILGDRSQAETAIPELIAFWTFAQQTYKHRSASAIIRYLQSIEQQFPDWMVDPDRGSMTKGLMLSALQQGYDITSEAGLKAFQTAHNQAIAANPEPLDQLRDNFDLAAVDLPQSLEELRSRIPPRIAAEMQALFEEMGAPTAPDGSPSNGVDFFTQMMGSVLGIPGSQSSPNWPNTTPGRRPTPKGGGEVLAHGSFPTQDEPAFRHSMLANKLDPERYVLTPAQADCLREQRITATQPGTIVQDVQTCLDFIGSQGCKVSNKVQQWGGQTLRDLNDRLSHPIAVNFQRPQQPSYPNLHGLYLLLRCTGLVQIVPVGRQYKMQQHPEHVAQWNQLNDNERYFTLLEAWLLHADSALLGDGQSFSPPGERWIYAWFSGFLTQASLRLASYAEQGKVDPWPGMMNLALADLFGLVKITQGQPEPKKGWRVKQITRSPWGEAVMILLFPHYMEAKTAATHANIAAFKHLQPLFQPYRPLWQQTLQWQQLEPVSDRHIFKVWLGSVWRRIAIDADATLYDLAELILASVNFDNDHLHQFTYSGPGGRKVEVGHPALQTTRLSSDQIQIGDMGLQIGSEIEYLFDFGDCWEFRIQLEGFAPAATTGQGFKTRTSRSQQAKKTSGIKAKAQKAHTQKRKPARHPVGEILERHGVAPLQYPDWDDD